MKYYASLLLGVSLVFFLTAVGALQCYTCVSGENGFCGDKFNSSEDALETCKEENEPVCMKVVFTLTQATDGNKVMQTRGCREKGFCRDTEDCKKGKCKGTVKKEELEPVESIRSCDECDKDKCNGGQVQRRGGIGILVIVLIVVVVMWSS